MVLSQIVKHYKDILHDLYLLLKRRHLYFSVDPGKQVSMDKDRQKIRDKTVFLWSSGHAEHTPDPKK